ncbi:MAG: NF041680 family putative transposase [Nocardioidaceae bacterium]
MTMIDDAGLPAQLPTGGGLLAADLDQFRTGLYSCLTRRSDALFELADAALCARGRVTDLARLSLEPVHRRGHGALYDALNAGRIDTESLGQLVAGFAVPKMPGPGGADRIVLAVDVSNWLRPDAATSPERSFCHTYARGGGPAQMIPGWKYLWIAALEPGATSWTALLEARRLHPDDDETAVTADRLRAVIGRLQTAGHWTPGDPPILVVADSGYDVTRLTWLLADLPVVLVARVRSNRVFYAPAGKRRGPTKGRGPRHGHKLALADSSTWPVPSLTTINQTPTYGTATTTVFDRQHQRIECRGPWTDHDGETPIIEGTLIRLTVDHLPGDRSPEPVWLWSSSTGATPGEVDHYWSAYLRRFDLEHTFRMLKQTLGWTRPMLRDPAAADRWTWLVLVVHTQLRLARPIAADHRLPWQRRLPVRLLTPARVRAGFHRVHRTTTRPANAPKATRPGPGRPPRRRNRHRAPIQPVGKAA